LPANGQRDGWHCDAAEQRGGWHPRLLGSEGEPQPFTINMCCEHQVGRRLIERIARSGKSEEQTELPDVPCQHRNSEHRHDRCRQADAESSTRAESLGDATHRSGQYGCDPKRRAHREADVRGSQSDVVTELNSEGPGQENGECATHRANRDDRPGP
jgi:hypothetical protein